MNRKKDIERIAALMIKRKESLAVAESVTAGNLQAAISLATDARMFFQGGITTYNLGQKVKHLHVEPIHAEACNCVSQKVATDMALNVSNLFSSNWSIALTGYAWPVPEFDIDKPFAFYSVALNGRVVASGKMETKVKAGKASQEYFVSEILKKFEHALTASRSYKKSAG